MSFFKLSDNKLELDLEYVLLYPEFKSIYDKDESSDKSYAWKIFVYIYEVSDYKSYSNKQNLSKEESKQHAIKLSGLDDDFMINNSIKDAIKVYKKLNYNTNAQLLKDLKATLELSIKINDRIYSALKKRLDDPKMEEGDVSTVIKLQTDLFNIIDNLPNKIVKVKELEAQVYEEIKKPRPIGRGTNTEIPESYEGNVEVEGI